VECDLYELREGKEDTGDIRGFLMLSLPVKCPNRHHEWKAYEEEMS